MARPPQKQRLFAHPARPRNQNVGGARQQGYGFFPASTADYTKGDEPTIAARLNRLGRALKLHLIGISGYRTPQHSVEVGGFANDPHTRGQASDTPGIEKVTESVLNRFGLTRPFSGAAEADHIQLFGGSKTPSSTTSNGNGPADWLRAGGWPSSLIPIMVAIGGAESGWQVDASHNNDDGSTDLGWLQVNSIHGFDAKRLQSDPIYNAAAAYKVYKKQGLNAWTVYTNGAYRSFLNKTPRVRSFGGGTATPVTRPGGDSPNAPDGPDVTSVLSDWSEAQSGEAADGNQFVGFNPGQLLTPLLLFRALTGSMKTPMDAFKLLAWIINPLNILRLNEFLVGLLFMVLGVQVMLVYGKNNGSGSISPSGIGRISRQIVTAKTGRTSSPSSPGGLKGSLKEDVS